MYYNNRFGMWSPTPAVKIILIINLVVFLITILSKLLILKLAVIPAKALFIAYPTPLAIFHLIYRSFTYMFVHAGLLHITFNMLALWLFGTPLEYAMGTRKFISFYLIVGSVTGFLVSFVVNGIVVGASGAIFGLLLGYAWFWPDNILLLFGIVPIKAKWLVLGYAVLEFFSLLGSHDNISHEAHLLGILIAAIWLYYNYKEERMLFRKRGYPHYPDDYY